MLFTKIGLAVIAKFEKNPSEKGVNMETQILAKEELVNVHFYKNEVLTDSEAIRQRRHDLHRAMILGNAYRYKVKIIFETDHGINSVETTVWHTTDSDVALKGGTTIPVRCIRNVIF